MTGAALETTLGRIRACPYLLSSHLSRPYQLEAGAPSSIPF
jgi:hypothetical protein